MIPETAVFTVRHCSRALAGDLCDDRDAWTCDLDLPGHLPNRRSTSGPTPTEAVEAMVAWLLTEPPVRRTDLPTVDDLVGIEPDLTEGLASEEWVRRRRGG